MTDTRQNQRGPSRDNLPIPNEAYAGPVLYDANDPAAVFPPIQEVRPPKGAPNVLVVLIDDAGFGASSAFGGPDQHAQSRSAWPPTDSSTPASTPPPSARRRGRRC